MSAARKKDPKRRVIKIVIIVCVVLTILTAGVFVLRYIVSKQYGASQDTEIQTGTAELGSISTTVSGSGNLEDEDVEAIEIPATVEIEDVVVETGDTVAEGDLLARVEMSTVVSSMSELQTRLDSLDEQLEDASEDSVDSTLKASVTGRIKKIYAAEGDDVATVMYEHGALAVMSLDGYMAVDIDPEALNAGDAVYITDSDGNEYDGSVLSAEDGKATVLVTDDGPAVDESVSVSDSDGSALGSGKLYIHESLTITGYAGTVSGIYAEENDKVSAGKKLFSLTDTEYSGNYNSLLAEREELEEQLQSLLKIYKEGAIYSTMSGFVSAGEEDSTATSSTSDSTQTVSSVQTSSESDEGTLELQTVVSICPGKTMTLSVSVDETSILNLSVGQEVTVTVDALEDEEFTGTVTDIDPTAASSGGVTSYTAIITLDKTESMLSGMSASAAIKIEGVENALIIPSDALTQTSSASYVYTSYDAETGELGDMVEVTVGLNNGTSVEITGGLSEGDTVYYIESEEESFSFGGRNMPGGFSGGDMPSGGFSGGDMSGGFSGGMPGRN